MKKTTGPVLTVEEKASKQNKQEIKGTGRLYCVTPIRLQYADVFFREGKDYD